MGSVTDPGYKRDWMRQYRKRKRDGGVSWRQKEGAPPKDGGRRTFGIYVEETRQLALESIQWMTHGKQAARMLAVYSYGAGLPLEWWRRRDTESIDDIIRAIEREMESPCQSLK